MNIDETTKGLSSKISADTFEKLNEANRFTRGLGSIKNHLLSKLGSGTALGKFKQNKAAGELMKRWKEYTAINNKPWDYNTLNGFLTKTFGPQAAQGLRQQLFTSPGANAGATAPNAQTATQGNVTPPSRAVPNAPAGSNLTANQPSSNTSSNTAPISNDRIKSSLIQAVAPPNPNKTKVMKLVQNLLSNSISKGRNSPDFRNTIKYLRIVQSRYGNKVPELNQIDLSQFTESQIKQIIGLTTYLVENRIFTKTGIDKAYSMFITEDRILGHEEIFQLFNKIAGWALDHGVMNVDNGKHSDEDDDDYGYTNSKRRMNFDNYEEQFDPETTPVHSTKLAINFSNEGLNLKDPNIAKIIQLAKSSKNIIDLFNKISAEKIVLPKGAAAAIMASH